MPVGRGNPERGGPCQRTRSGQEAPTKAALSHALRSLEDDQEHAHGKPNIDAARIGDNVVMLPDGSGGLRPAGPGGSVESVLDDLHDRVSHARGGTRRVKDKKTGETKTVDVALRSDATEAVEFIIQLDPEYTGAVVDMDDDQQADAREKMYVMVDEIRSQTGPENTIAVAEHWDETSPHIQMFVVPVDETGTLVGTRIMGEKKGDWSWFHDRLRYRLREVGYDATFDRVAGGATHENLKAYKAQRKKEVSLTYERQAMDVSRDAVLADREAARAMYSRAAERNDAAAAAEERVDAKVASLDAREGDLSALEASLTARVKAVTKKETAVDEREASLTDRACDLDDKYEAVISHAERAVEDIIATAKAGAEEMSRDRATAAVDEGRDATQNLCVRAAQRLRVKDPKTGTSRTLDAWLSQEAQTDGFRFDKKEQAKVERETYGSVKAWARKARDDARRFLQQQREGKGRDTGFSR